jgi:hypothetical protein
MQKPVLKRFPIDSLATSGASCIYISETAEIATHKYKKYLPLYPFLPRFYLMKLFVHH